MIFSLTVIGSTATTTPILINKSWKYILGTLALKVKKVLALTGDVKTISKLQDVNLSVNNF